MCMSVWEGGCFLSFQLPVLHMHPALQEPTRFYLLQCIHFVAHILQPATCIQTLYCCDTQMLLLSTVSFHGRMRLEHNKELWLHINATLSWSEEYEV